MATSNLEGPGLKLLRLGDLLDAWDAEAALAFDALRQSVQRGPITALPSLDDALGGSLTPGFHVVHGGPGTGKTALILQIAALCGVPALLVECEMSPLELLRRHTARATTTHIRRLKSGELTPELAHTLALQAVQAAPQLAIVDATQESVRPEWLRQAADIVRGNERHLLILVDSIHAWADGAPGDLPEYERVSEAVVALQALAAELACPILAVAERNRASMQSGGLSAGAGSRKLEYAAESVWDLQRDLDAAPDAAGEVAVMLRLVKNRNGVAGRQILLRFHGGLQRFREL